jgi:hypothetical protein
MSASAVISEGAMQRSTFFAMAAIILSQGPKLDHAKIRGKHYMADKVHSCSLQPPAVGVWFGVSLK